MSQSHSLRRQGWRAEFNVHMGWYSGARPSVSSRFRTPNDEDRRLIKNRSTKTPEHGRIVNVGAAESSEASGADASDHSRDWAASRDVARGKAEGKL